ncbi:MAG: hypothetical protein ABL931_00975, partial [Usitatibacteraceae bacterium]
SPLNATAIDPSREISAITDFDGARVDAAPAARLAEVRLRAGQFRKKMLAESDVLYYRSINLITVPYPVGYGLRDAAKCLSPFMNIFNRLFVVQYRSTTGVKTLLFSPSDIVADEKTPYFQTLLNTPLRPLLEKVLVPFRRTVEEALALTGIRPDQVDYISYDHLHTQDVRKWMGSNGSAGYFPNAKLLVMRQEWESAKALLPMQAMWYCPNGISGLDPARVVLLDSSVRLGDGVALVHTPGHTEGNHSLVAKTPEGLMVTSENGVSADSYSPRASKIGGVRAFAERYGVDVIMNANTLENSNDQYISMELEKAIAGPANRNPAFYNIVPSSELTPNFFFPGLKPTFSFGELEFGRPVLGA